MTNNIKILRINIVPYITYLFESEEDESNLIPGEDIATATKKIYKINQIYESCSGIFPNFNNVVLGLHDLVYLSNVTDLIINILVSHHKMPNRYGCL